MQVRHLSLAALLVITGCRVTAPDPVPPVPDDPIEENFWRWSYSSLPPGVTAAKQDTGMIWYNFGRLHRVIRKEDVYPVVLLDQDEGREEIPVLNLRYAADPADPHSSWAGIQTVVVPGLRDFSGKGYVEVLLRAEGAIIHLDCGSVGEDQIREASWNGLLDTEDQHPQNGTFERPQEDIGFDGVSDGEEPGEGADPAGDNYRYSEADPLNYENVNGTEGNQRLDTEDLNGNGCLDMNEEFFRITIDTGSPTYFVQDCLDGWRLYRVSLDDPGITTSGSPDWSRIESVRVWVSGPNARPDGLVQFGYIDVGWSR